MLDVAVAGASVDVYLNTLATPGTFGAATSVSTATAQR